MDKVKASNEEMFATVKKTKKLADMLLETSMDSTAMSLQVC